VVFGVTTPTIQENSKTPKIKTRNKQQKRTLGIGGGAEAIAEDERVVASAYFHNPGQVLVQGRID